MKKLKSKANSNRKTYTELRTISEGEGKDSSGETQEPRHLSIDNIDDDKIKP